MFIKIIKSYKMLKELTKKVNLLLQIVDPTGFYSSGERQVTADLEKIRKDHIARYKFASNYINNNQPVMALDMACGIGYGTYYMAKNSNKSKFIGVDICSQAIEYGNTYYKLKNNEFLCKNALETNFEEKFDVITSFETIEHIPDDTTFIKKCYELLNKNGTFICSVPNQEKLPYSSKRFPYHIKHYTVSEIKQKLTDIGFSIQKIMSQHDSKNEEIKNDENGLFLLFVCKK